MTKTKTYNEHIADVWPVGLNVELLIGVIGYARGKVIAHSPAPDGGSGLILSVQMAEGLGEYCSAGDVRKVGVGMSIGGMQGGDIRPAGASTCPDGCTHGATPSNGTLVKRVSVDELFSNKGRFL